ncbi:MAG TPA: substrate binding domain-containing protein, partial [Rhodopila sp.]|nr:substrate binding domain-containing protein [Rhodopila sp.]
TELLRRHPGLTLDLVVSERVDDLIAERLDLALRFGQSEDSSMVSRAVAVMGYAAVAAPGYLERFGAPTHPSELATHTCIVHENGPDSSHWLFTGPDGPVDVEVTSKLRSNNALVARQAAVSGYGIAMLGEPLILSELRTGRLYRLLPDYSIRERQVFLTYPSRRHLPQRTRVVIDFLVEQFHTLEARLRDARAWGESEATWLV